MQFLGQKIVQTMLADHGHPKSRKIGNKQATTQEQKQELIQHFKYKHQ